MTWTKTQKLKPRPLVCRKCGRQLGQKYSMPAIKVDLPNGEKAYQHTRCKGATNA